MALTSDKRPYLILAACLTVLTPTALCAAGEATGKDKAVLFFGVYTQCYKFDQSLSNYDLKISNAHSQRVQDFPSVKDLFQAKLIILSDVNGSEFTESQIKLMKSFVERGGGLLVMGGPFTLGVGQLQEQGLAEILPVELAPFDLKWEKQGKPFSKTADSALLQGVDLSRNPVVSWIHKVKPKEGTQVVLSAGDYPLLVGGAYGKGKVMVFTGTPMGLPPQGQTPFWEWDGWPKLMQNVATYLSAKEGAQ